MASKLDSFYNKLKSLLECPVCLESVENSRNIRQCSNGHILCSECAQRIGKVGSCPTCRTSMISSGRALFVENMLEIFIVPCKFKDHGCQVEFKMKENQKSQHEKEFCKFRWLDIKDPDVVIQALQMDCIEAAFILLTERQERKIDIEIKTYWTTFTLACQKGLRQVVEICLENASFDHLNELIFCDIVEGRSSWLTGFQIACAQGQIQVVEAILDWPEAKKIIMPTPFQTRTCEPWETHPMYLAIHAPNSIEILQYLINHPGDHECLRITPELTNKRSILMETCFMKKSPPEELLDFITMTCPDALGFHPGSDYSHVLIECCKKDFIKTAKYILEKKLTVGAWRNFKLLALQAFCTACAHGSFQIVNFMLMQNHLKFVAKMFDPNTQFDISEQCYPRCHPWNATRFSEEMTEPQIGLFEACKNDQDKVIAALLTHSENANFKVSDCKTRHNAFTLACQHNSIKVVELILENHEHFDLNNVVIPHDKSSHPANGLHIACKLGHYQIVKSIIFPSGFIMKIRNVNGGCLSVACAKGHKEIVKLLCSSPAVDVNELCSGMTSLFFAVLKADLEIIKILLNHEDLDINCLCKYSEKNPQGNQKELGKFMTAFHMACIKGSTEIIKLLIQDKRLDYNVKNSDNFTVLQMACNEGHDKVVEMIFAAKRIFPDLDIKIHGNELHLACFKGHEKVIALFADDFNPFKTDFNAQDQEGSTPLINAIQSKKVQAVQAVLKSKDVDLNKTGSWTPIEFACASGPQIIDLMLQAAEQRNVKLNLRVQWLHSLGIVYHQNDFNDVYKMILQAQLRGNVNFDKSGSSEIASKDLQCAIKRKRDDIVVLMIQTGYAKVEDESNDAKRIKQDFS